MVSTLNKTDQIEQDVVESQLIESSFLINSPSLRIASKQRSSDRTGHNRNHPCS
jgi:hypothetical protein